MTRIAWPALMRLGLADLGLAPDVFWNLTPAELLLIAGAGEPRGTMTRDGLDALISAYPDTQKGGSHGDT